MPRSTVRTVHASARSTVFDARVVGVGVGAALLEDVAVDAAEEELAHDRDVALGIDEGHVHDLPDLEAADQDLAPALARVRQ